MALAAVAGFVDAVGYLSLGDEFVAHMTGNTSRLGQHVGLGQLHNALPLLLAVAVFVVAVAMATALLDAGLPTSLALVAEAGLLAALMAYGATLWHGNSIPRGGAGFYVATALAVAAMGVQSAIVVRWRSRTIRTTFLTGMLTLLGQSLARLGTDEPPKRRENAGDAVLIVLLWLAFAGAGAVGAVLLGRCALRSLALPLATVLVLAGVARRDV